ncbi:MAG: HlyD family efflux transporter periplasmic adaptor subunit [Verrucomicrobia bacterium]|nr:HlyD family efflux transporter periplasmic adaptor subunit [Verrucomicrobiota bacterium]
MALVDIARPDLARKRRRNRWLATIAALVALGAITLGLSRLQPAAPSVDGATVLRDTVKRGSFLRDVHGNGTLVPEDIIWITATTQGRVERILLLPGVEVTADTVLVELSNPELVQAAFDAESAVQSAEAQLEKLKVQLESDQLTLEAVLATLKSEAATASIEAEADERLRVAWLVPELTAKKSRTHADELQSRLQLEKRRLEISARSATAQMLVQESELAKLRKQYQLKQQQVAALRVKAGFDGVLQRIGDVQPLQQGQQLAVGANLARIANPAKLKAEIKIAETQAKDVQHGQVVSVDTRNGVVAGHVIRIDPAVVNGTVTVDVALEGTLPKGARPDLSVDARIILEKLENVLHVGRPVNGQSESKVSLFKIIENGRAALRVPVQLGRTSVSLIEVISGLQEGDQIIVSDMSQWDAHDRIRLN